MIAIYKKLSCTKHEREQVNGTNIWSASQWKTFGKWPVIVHRYLLEKDH